MSLPANALEQAVLVVAHPDDEILWFGSIVERVRRIVIVFADSPNQPELADARRRALARHPLTDRIDLLGLSETGTFDSMDWEHPDITERGPRLRDAAGATAMAETWQKLEGMLDDAMAGCRNVYTHNPWGDYGNEEHILVHHAVVAAAARNNVRCWFSNYVSNRSQALMTRYIRNFDSAVFGEAVDTERMRAAAACYQEAGCWTWLPGYRWFDREYFAEAPLTMRERPAAGSLFPMNFVRLRRAPGGPAKVRAGFVERLRRRVAGKR
jgi:LmbE family N-acetylglucosaminyl deacetylase